MRTLLDSLATAAALAVAVVPAASAAEPSFQVGGEAATPSPPVVAPDPTATPAGPYDGTIVVDPTFVSGGELPTQPASAPSAAPQAPGVTPPPTDAAGAVPAPRGQSPVFVLLGAAAALALLTAGVPRRRHGRR
jgi:hypothetical protein